MKNQSIKNAEKEATVREGTRCQFCGEPIRMPISSSFISVPVNSNGGRVYAHVGCTRVRNYGYKNDDRFHVPTGSGFCYGVEWESDVLYDPQTALMLRYRYGLVPTSDCSIAGAEYKSPIINGLHGVKDTVDGIATALHLADASDDVGHHCNVSLAEWTERNIDIRLFDSVRETLQSALEAIIALPASERVRVFGRDFVYYADARVGAEHTCTFHLHWNRIEFRLAKYRNTMQFCDVVRWLKEIVNICQAVMVGKITEKIACKQARRSVEKLVNGTATFQASERNQKAY